MGGCVCTLWHCGLFLFSMNPLFATCCYLQNKQGWHKRQSFSLLSHRSEAMERPPDSLKKLLSHLQFYTSHLTIGRAWRPIAWFNSCSFYSLTIQFKFLLHGIQLMVFFIAKIIDMITSYAHCRKDWHIEKWIMKGFCCMKIVDNQQSTQLAQDCHFMCRA